MQDRPDTHPLHDGPPIVFTAEERTALIAMVLGSIAVMTVLVLGLICAAHRVEATVAFLAS